MRAKSSRRKSAPATRQKFRVDFRFVNISDDPDRPKVVSVLDPDRYEFKTSGDGEAGWINTLDPRRLFFSRSVINDMLSRAGQLPLTDMQPLISDAAEYIRSRAGSIERALREGMNDTSFRTIINEEMETPSTRHFVIMPIDLVGSTKLSQEMEPEDFARVIQTYSREISLLCAQFHGRVLKHMGDGAILYFPTGSVARKHDFAMDCATSLQDLVLDGLNGALAKLNLPRLACRIGVDSGFAPVVTIGQSGMTNNVDIIGEVVNIAAKIEKAAPTNGVCVGESVAINTHTLWLKHLKRRPAPEGWPYVNEDGEPYGVYSLELPRNAE